MIRRKGVISLFSVERSIVNGCQVVCKNLNCDIVTAVNLYKTVKFYKIIYIFKTE